MKTVTICASAALIYAVLTFVAACKVALAGDSVFLVPAFLAWNVACAVLFAYAVARYSGSARLFVLLVTLFGSLLQAATVQVMISDTFGVPLSTALQRLPWSVLQAAADQLVLYLAWLGMPVLAAGAVVCLQLGLRKR